MTAKVTIYTTPTCSYCMQAKQLLNKKNIPYTEIRVDLDPAILNEMEALSARKTVPQIIINGKPIGGFDDLVALELSGQLDKILKN